MSTGSWMSRRPSGTWIPEIIGSEQPPLSLQGAERDLELLLPHQALQLPAPVYVWRETEVDLHHDQTQYEAMLEEETA